MDQHNYSAFQTVIGIVDAHWPAALLICLSFSYTHSTLGAPTTEESRRQEMASQVETSLNAVPFVRVRIAALRELDRVIGSQFADRNTRTVNKDFSVSQVREQILENVEGPYSLTPYSLGSHISDSTKSATHTDNSNDAATNLKPTIDSMVDLQDAARDVQVKLVPLLALEIQAQERENALLNMLPKQPPTTPNKGNSESGRDSDSSTASLPSLGKNPLMTLPTEEAPISLPKTPNSSESIGTITPPRLSNMQNVVLPVTSPIEKSASPLLRKIQMLEGDSSIPPRITPFVNFVSNSPFSGGGNNLPTIAPGAPKANGGLGEPTVSLQEPSDEPRFDFSAQSAPMAEAGGEGAVSDEPAGEAPPPSITAQANTVPMQQFLPPGPKGGSERNGIFSYRARDMILRSCGVSKTSVIREFCSSLWRRSPAATMAAIR